MQRSMVKANASAIEAVGKRTLFALLCLVVGALCASTARADDDDDDRKWRKKHHSWVHEPRNHHRDDHDRNEHRGHYYPRSRYYGPAPRHANANVIITLPLW